MGEQHKAYCLKCREKVHVKNHEHTTLKNKRPAIRGHCSTCGSTIYKIGQG